MKCLVYGICILEFIQSVLSIRTGFQKYVSGFGDVEAIDRVETGWLSTPIISIGELS